MPRCADGRRDVHGHWPGKVVHQRLATHWARLIELLYAAERIVELATDPEITSDNFHTSRPKNRPKAWASSKRRAAR